MKKDTHKTDIVFRIDLSKYGKMELFALLPYEISNDYFVTGYTHIGQHSAYDYKHCISISRPAKPKEYADLKKEMESLGYNINIVKRQNYSKYLKSYNNQTK